MDQDLVTVHMMAVEVVFQLERVLREVRVLGQHRLADLALARAQEQLLQRVLALSVEQETDLAEQLALSL